MAQRVMHCDDAGQHSSLEHAGFGLSFLLQGKFEEAAAEAQQGSGLH